MTKMKVTVTFLFTLLLLLQKISGEQEFNDQKPLILPDSYNIGWMATLDNDKFISEITIPGTHDALALHGGPLAECQAWSLENQLKAGIRYFDLRVFGMKLWIMHGIIYQHKTFTEVQNTIANFLSKYPSETVLVRVKPVFFFRDKVPYLVKKEINNTISWINSTMPKIGEVRGKIVYVQKNEFKLGVSLTETDKKGDFKVTDIEQKKEKIKNHLNQARETCKNGCVILNYSSGTGIGSLKGLFKGLTPKTVAQQMNPWLYTYLKDVSIDNPKPSFGIIAMDFPGIDLIQTIIKLNL